MARRASAIRTARGKGAPLLLEAGDLALDRKPADDREMEVALRKWSLLLSAYRRFRHDAILPGGADFFAGREFLAGGGEDPLPFTALNLVDRDTGRAILPPSVAATASGRPVVVTGLWGSGTLSAPALAGMGLAIADPSNALSAFLSAPRPREALVLVMALLPPRETEALAVAAPSPALFLVPGDGPSSLPSVRAAGRSVVVRVPPRSRHLCEIVLSPPAPGGGASSFVAGDLVERTRSLREEAMERIRTLPPRRSAPYREALEEYDRFLAKARGAWSVSARCTPLSASTPSDPAILALVERFRKDAERIAAVPPKGKGRPSPYVGAPRCGECHPERLSAWGKDRHSRAFGSLASSGDTWNPDCLPCHAAPGSAGGIGGKAIVAEGVGCEACHGAGKGHPPGRLAVPGERRCLSCHRLSPAFRFREKAPLLGCARSAAPAP